MKLTQNHGQVGYPMLHEAMKLSWYKLFKKTEESRVSKWVYVTNGKAKLPSSVDRLEGVFIFNRCGDLIPLYEDLIKNILPPLKKKCTCNSCDHSDCLCSEMDNSAISLVDVIIDGTTYQNKYLIKVLKNGDVVEEKHEWVAAYDLNGDFTRAEEVVSQSTKCQVQVKSCGCPIKNEENSKKLLSHGCIKNSCAPYLRKQYPALYNEIGYYKVDNTNREVHLFNNDGSQSILAQVMLVYESNGSDMLVPEYAQPALIALLDWTKKQYGPLYSIPEKREAKRHFKYESSEMTKYLNPIPFEFASEAGNAFAKSYYNTPHPDMLDSCCEEEKKCDTSSSTGSSVPTTTVVNNYYSDATLKFFKRIIGQTDSPVANTNTFQHDDLIGLGKYSADRIEIVVGGVEMYNWGDNPTFSFVPSTGTITFTAGYTWQAGSSLKIDLRQ